ncbi:MAG TPA: toll/interleukin-1 receptor domain-containing protein, partial [Anaerolineales bacterium]
MQRIFISYSRKDIGFVRKLAGDLEKAGYDVWWDFTDLRGGDDWPRVIPAAIESSQYIIVVLSPNSAVSDWVEKEYTQALGLRKKIIPIMLARSRVPFALNTINYIDFRG